MDHDALTAAAADLRWPKWATMCHLRSLGCPVLNAVCLVPGHGMSVVREAVGALANVSGTDRLMVRSDGGRETDSYYRGGNSFPLDEVERHATELLAAGRMVILLEPTDRHDNQLSVLLRMDRLAVNHPGTFTVEALGAGYDVGDLTRGGIRPQVTVSVENVTWHRYARPWWGDLCVSRCMAPENERARRDARIRRLAQLGFAADDRTGTLTSTGHVELGTDPSAAVVRAFLGWFDIAFVVAATHPNRGWRCLATSLSELGDGRTVYWDIVDSAHKYAMASTDRSIA
jgi:hypothetical protein